MRVTNRFVVALTILLLGLFSVQSFAQSDPILTYTATHDLLPSEDTHWVEVYEDGTAFVHYPVFMKSAGDYVIQLSPYEVQQLRLLLEHPLVQKFDHEKVKAEKKQIDDQSSEVFEISDNQYSEFEIHLQSQSTNHPSMNDQRIRWANLSIDARRYPEIGIFRKLAEIEDSLLDLDQHPTAQRIE